MLLKSLVKRIPLSMVVLAITGKLFAHDYQVDQIVTLPGADGEPRQMVIKGKGFTHGVEQLLLASMGEDRASCTVQAGCRELGRPEKLALGYLQRDQGEKINIYQIEAFGQAEFVDEHDLIVDKYYFHHLAQTSSRVHLLPNLPVQAQQSIISINKAFSPYVFSCPQSTAASEQVTVTFLGQLHWIPHHEALEESERSRKVGQTAQAQLSLARYLEHHEAEAIFLEGLSHDLHADSLGHDLYPFRTAEVRAAFPEGIPATLEALTVEQRNLLAQLGAPKILLALKAIKRLYATHYRRSANDARINSLMDLHRQLAADYRARKHELHQLQGRHDRLRHQQAILDKSRALRVLVEHMERVLDTINFRIDAKRERMALDKISEYLAARPASDQRGVTLVFGQAHNFARYFEQAPPNLHFQQPPLSSSQAAEHTASTLPGIRKMASSLAAGGHFALVDRTTRWAGGPGSCG